MILVVAMPCALISMCMIILYACANNEALEDHFRARDRDRRKMRRGMKVKSRYRPRQKLSQDGKGGRSANS